MRMPHRRVVPPPISADTSVADLIENHFLAYNSARLYEACRLYVEDMLGRYEFEDATKLRLKSLFQID